MTVTTSPGSLPPPVAQSLGMKMLAVPTPYLVHNLAADLGQMPAHGGDIFRQERDNPLPTSTVPLGNSGIHPPPTPLTSVNIDAKMSFYGQYILINEQTELQNQNPVLNRAAKRLGVALRQTEDELTRNMLSASASSINCVGGTNGDNPSEVSRYDVDQVVQALSNANAMTIADNIQGEDRLGTGPVRDAYLFMGSTDLIGDLERVTGFRQKNDYPQPDKALRSEWGAVSNSRWFLSSIGSYDENASMNGNRIYNIFFAGMEAYSVIEQDGYSSQYIYRPPIYDGPLALNASVGYKFAQVPVITQDSWVGKLRCTLSV